MGRMGRRAKCMTDYLAVPLAMLIVIGSWAVLAAAFAGAMLTGDYCQSPQANTVALADDNKLVILYTTCDGDNLLAQGLRIGQVGVREVAAALVPIGERLAQVCSCLSVSSIPEVQRSIIINGISIKNASSLDYYY